ncbi:hypothetical protein HMPREF1325_0093 [Treponema socranskii subsp. socranskii VPI DR56BR1116 = ATCC 35536]|uniref:Transposase/invertase (TIGR01784 family) n=1 Tax=Treponema socranskii subsp. socranskii VPI DR56BR1116 = ATCC 35536 TaxID=1125725 RepID=U1FJM7_TRESO|nr:hypothetical protein HMPREF1325_0093 [Treponema socranskii subsp. socranskii VPI DR56BR1116 = ATCC 35536]
MDEPKRLEFGTSSVAGFIRHFRLSAKLKNEQARQEYRFMSGFEMDAREEGIQQGFADGSYRKALETAKILKQLGDSVQKIMQATGLSKEEVEAIN